MSPARLPGLFSVVTAVQMSKFMCEGVVEQYIGKSTIRCEYDWDDASYTFCLRVPNWSVKINDIVLCAATMLGMTIWNYYKSGRNGYQYVFGYEETQKSVHRCL